MLSQKLPSFLRKRLNSIRPDPEKIRCMRHTLHRPEFYINAVRAVLDFVNSGLLALYYGRKVEPGLLSDLQLTNTSIVVSPSR